jgi:hypothetical protein
VLLLIVYKYLKLFASVEAFYFVGNVSDDVRNVASALARDPTGWLYIEHSQNRFQTGIKSG